MTMMRTVVASVDRAQGKEDHGISAPCPYRNLSAIQEASRSRNNRLGLKRDDQEKEKEKEENREKRKKTKRDKSKQKEKA